MLMIMVWNNWCTSLLEKKYIGFITHFASWSDSGYSLPDKLSDHDVGAGTLKVVIPPHKKKKKKKKTRRKVYLYQKGNYESMRKDAVNFANEKYFNGYRLPAKKDPAPPPGNFADIVYLKEQSFLHRIRDVCTF